MIEFYLIAHNFKDADEMILNDPSWNTDQGV